MVLNREHEDYPEFQEKWDAIVARYERDRAEAEAKCPDWRGLDHPYAGEVTKRFHQELTKLQWEYGYLYGS